MCLRTLRVIVRTQRTGLPIPQVLVEYINSLSTDYDNRNIGHDPVFTRGDPDALAAVMLRAATETGLWERLSAAIPEPPSLAAMVAGFLDVYGLKQKAKPPITPVTSQPGKGSKKN